MFRFDYRKEERKKHEKELMKNVKMSEKPKFKDLISIMLAQYLVILPVAVIGIVVFFLLLRGILYLWGV